MNDSTPNTTVQTGDDDLSLVHACKLGDAAAFEKLVARYDRRLFRIAQHITHNREDAQDAVQEAFLKAFRKLSQFQENSLFSTWLTRITINEALMKLRRQVSAREVCIDENIFGEEDTAPFELPDPGSDPEDLCRGSELREILSRALQELRPSLRVVFVLRDIEGLSTEQAADALGLTHPAVKSRLNHARRKLRERLRKYLGKSYEVGSAGFSAAANSTVEMFL